MAIVTEDEYQGYQISLKHIEAYTAMVIAPGGKVIYLRDHADVTVQDVIRELQREIDMDIVQAETLEAEAEYEAEAAEALSTAPPTDDEGNAVHVSDANDMQRAWQEAAEEYEPNPYDGTYSEA